MSRADGAPTAARMDRLIGIFGGSHDVAAASDANLGNQRRIRRDPDRNFKFAALDLKPTKSGEPP
jgi:hypothetical protein